MMTEIASPYFDVFKADKTECLVYNKWFYKTLELDSIDVIMNLN